MNQRYMIDFGHRGEIVFFVPERYRRLEAIGLGAEGFVCRAVDTLRENRNVAIKKCYMPFDNIARAKHAYREINIIQIVNHRNIVSLFDMFLRQENGPVFQDIYLVMDLMETNLHQAIRRGGINTHRRISFLMYQLLCGVRHLHSAGIIHRDIKPANILVRSDCTLKISDFGHSRGTSESEMTGYVTTRYYRAPEVIMREKYDQQIDIWSVGCTMAEIVLSEVLFGMANEYDQIVLIIRTLGTPTIDYIQTLQSDIFRNYLRNRPHSNGVRFDELFRDHSFPRNNRNANLNSNNARHLLSRMLVINPRNRITIDQALNHDYIRVFIPRDRSLANAELNSPTLGPYDDTFDNAQRTINEWRQLIRDRIEEYERRQPLN